MAKTRGDFTDILVRRQILSPDQLDEAKNLQQSTGVKLQDALIKLDYATMEQIMTAIAEFHGLQFIDLTEVTIPAAVVELVPESVARENVVLPLSQDNGALKIIMSDPSDFDTVQKLQFILNKDIQPVLAPREQIVEAINRHYGKTETESVDSMLAEFTDTAIDFTETEHTTGAGFEESDAPVVKLVNLIIQEAVGLRASDVHIEPFADRVRVRYRIDGVLVERDSPPRRLLAPILSRIKIMASIDISEKRRPQDGRITMNLAGKHYDLRVSMLPTNHGQSAVMRILDRSSIQMSIKDLGFADDDYQRFQGIIKRPNGIFLVTGPTGSGKTTTLYAALNELNRPDRKIITAEDPVEYYLPGINQVEVKHTIGLDFARIIRAMLRQAPNIILVGEIRDKETAEIAVQASLTGHLVFSTLHTNDAPGAVTRLVDMGVEPYLVSSSLEAVLAQRLVRVLCPRCKQADDSPTAAALKDKLGIPANTIIYRSNGCRECRHTGFFGRHAIFEWMDTDNEIRQLVLKNASTDQIREAARRARMKTLAEDGWRLVRMGLTTVEEVLSVTTAKEVAQTTDQSGAESRESSAFSAGGKVSLPTLDPRPST